MLANRMLLPLTSMMMHARCRRLMLSPVLLLVAHCICLVQQLKQATVSINLVSITPLFYRMLMGQAATSPRKACCRPRPWPGLKRTKSPLAGGRLPGSGPSNVSCPRWRRLRKLLARVSLPTPPLEVEANPTCATAGTQRRRGGKPTATMGQSGPTTSRYLWPTSRIGRLACLRSTRSTPIPGGRG